MMFLWLPFLFAIPFAIFFMLRPAGAGGGCGMSHSMAQPTASVTPDPQGPEPIQIARTRLARGEISPTEFDEIRRALQG